MQSNRAELASSLDQLDFSFIEQAFRTHYELPLETIDLDAIPVSGRCSTHCNPEFCGLVRGSDAGLNRCRQDRLRSLAMAFEIGQPYETICHAGLFLVCVPVMQSEQPLGGIFFGKCLSADLDDDSYADLSGRLHGLRVDERKLRTAAGNLPVLSAREIYKASQYLFILLYEQTRLDPRVIKWSRFKTEPQADESHGYPFDRERELIDKVRAGDSVGAREILNRILGSILFGNPGKIDILKARLVELLSILSRGAAEAGADIEPLLARNVGYINKVISMNTQDEICAWISMALDDFIEHVYKQQDLQPRDRIDLAKRYIDERFAGKMTVEDVAAAANLSESRLSHLFREKLGLTVIDYLLGARLSRARTLLVTTDKTCIEIAFETGFNDPSYFTRCFKDRTGVSPSVYRRENPAT